MMIRDHDGQQRWDGGALSGFGTAFSLPGARPLKLFLDTTNKCNLRCVMCHFAYEAAHKTATVQWTPEFLARIEHDVLPYTWHAQLSLGTEPLMWKHFPLLLDACRRAGVPIVDMYTNGLLMTEPLARKIVATPMSRVQFSLEGATPETFERVRVGGSFARFVRAVEMLAAARKAAGSEYPRLQFNITMLRRNADQIEGILHLAHRLGVDYLDFRHVIMHDELGMESDSFLADKAGFNRLMARVRSLAAELGLTIVVQPDDFELPAANGCPTAATPRVERCDEAARPISRWRLGAGLRRVFDGRLRHIGDHALARSYGVQYIDHDLPSRQPVGAVHPARVTVRNDSDFVWHSDPTATDGVIGRGEVALVVRLDGEWIDTRKLPAAEVAPGERITVEFPLQAPAQPGEHVLAVDLIEWGVTHFENVGVALLSVPWRIDEAGPVGSDASAARFYRVRYLDHDIPERLPAGATYQATVRLRNDGSFVWRCSVPSRANWTRLQRGEVALAVRWNGDWIATGLLPTPEVHPGEEVAVAFALPVPPGPGPAELQLDVIECDFVHFRDVGVDPLTVPVEVRETDPEPTVACTVPWKEFVVRPDGSVVPCTFWYTRDTMGNLHQQSFEAIWEGPAYRRLRTELLTGDHGVNCRQCPLRGIGRVDDASAHRSANLEKALVPLATGHTHSVVPPND